MYLAVKQLTKLYDAHPVIGIMLEYKNMEHGKLEYLNYIGFEKFNFHNSDYNMNKQGLGNINWRKILDNWIKLWKNIILRILILLTKIARRKYLNIILIQRGFKRVKYQQEDSTQNL